jgi:hypothetical protein
MAEDFELLMRRAQGEGPSPEFVASLRERIVEATSPEARPGVETIVEIDRYEAVSSPTIPRRLVALAAAVAVIVVAGAVIVSTVRPEVSTIAEEPASFVADAKLLTDGFFDIEPGTYLVDTVGTPFTLTLDQKQYVGFNKDGRVGITHADSQDEGDRTIEFTRLSVLLSPNEASANPDEVSAPSADLEEGWPADDFGGWLDNPPEQILISNRQETTLGGLRATRIDLELGETDCRLGGEACMLLGSNRSLYDLALFPGSKYRIWLVDQGDEDPLAVIVSIDRASDLEWFDTAETILSSLAFGEVGPNPVLAASPGSTELPFLGGIRIELEVESVALQHPGGFGQVSLTDWMADTQFLADPLDLDGSPVTTADELLAILRATDVEVAEIDEATVGGFGARVVEIRSDSSEPVVTLAARNERAWRAPPRGRIWLIEHPNRGLLMITAQVFENLDLVFPLVVTQTERIIESLEFIES